MPTTSAFDTRPSPPAGICSGHGAGACGPAQPVADRQPQPFLRRQGGGDEVAPLLIELAQKPVQSAGVGRWRLSGRATTACAFTGASARRGKEDTDLATVLLGELGLSGTRTATRERAGPGGGTGVLERRSPSCCFPPFTAAVPLDAKATLFPGERHRQ